jgi:hypothetical protein
LEIPTTTSSQLPYSSPSGPSFIYSILHPPTCATRLSSGIRYAAVSIIAIPSIHVNDMASEGIQLRRRQSSLAMRVPTIPQDERRMTTNINLPATANGATLVTLAVATNLDLRVGDLRKIRHLATMRDLAWWKPVDSRQQRSGEPGTGTLSYARVAERRLRWTLMAIIRSLCVSQAPLLNTVITPPPSRRVLQFCHSQLSQTPKMVRSLKSPQILGT